MKINTTMVLTTLKGNEIKNQDEKPITLGEYISGAMLSASANLTPEQSFRRFQIAQIVVQEGEVEMPDNFLDEIRTACHIRYGGDPLTFGRLCEVIGAPKPGPIRNVRQPAQPTVQTRDRSHLLRRPDAK